MDLLKSLDSLNRLNQENANKPKEQVVFQEKRSEETEEQYEIINSSENVIKVAAYAGTGKTYTLKKYADKRMNKSGLYVAFNKELQVDAERKFDRNVQAFTMHSIAYQKYGRGLAHKLVNQIYAEQLNALNISICNNKELNIEYQQAIINSLQNFMYSSEYAISKNNFEIEGLIKILEMEKQLGRSEISEKLSVNKILKDIQTVWDVISNPEDTRLSATHDVYLKMFHLGKHKLNYDFIMLDEAQDTNPVMLSIFENQQTQRILVGDSYQSIYQFREAVDAMSVGYADKTFKLTKSFRFGQVIADAANTILAIRNESSPIIGGGKTEGVIYLRENIPDSKLLQYKEVAVVTRSNSKMFEEALYFSMKGYKVFIEGGKVDKDFETIKNLYDLYSGHKTRDSFLNAVYEMKGDPKEAFEYLAEYAKERNDQEWYLACQIVKKYKDRTPIMLETLINSVVKDRKEAQIIVTNVHKSKGLEYDQVILSNDFSPQHLFSEKINNVWSGKEKADPMPTLYLHKSLESYRNLSKEERRKKQLENEELNLIYVAMTRAKKMLIVPEAIARHIEKLNQHIQEKPLIEGYDIKHYFELARYPEFKNYLAKDLQQVIADLKQQRDLQLKYKVKI